VFPITDHESTSNFGVFPMTARFLTRWLCPTGMGIVLSFASVAAFPQPPSVSQATPPSGGSAAPKTLGKEEATKVLALQQTIEQLRRAGKFTEAMEPARQVLAICEQALGSEEWQAADARREIETLEHITKLPQEGRTAMASVGALDEQRSELKRKAQHAEAERISRELLEIRRRWLGADHPDTAATYDVLAGSLKAQGKYAEAEPLYQKALAAKLEALGAGHPETATTYRNFAANLNAQGRFAEAEPLYQKALAISLKALGDGHTATAAGYNDLAFNLEDQGKHAEAETLYRKALAIRLEALGADHPDTAGSYNNVAGSLDAQGKHFEAEILYKKALAIRIKALDADHPDVAEGYNNLAANLMDQGKDAEAETLFQKALAIRLKVLGPNHPTTADGYNNLAASLSAQGKYSEAEPLYPKALAIFIKVLGADHPDTANCYNNLAFNLNAQGKYSEAEPLYQKVLANRLKWLGADHPATATSYNNLANNLNAQGKYAKAEALYRNAMAITLKALGADHPAMANCYNNLAGNATSQGKYEEAEPLFQKGLAIRLKTLGEGHRDTALSYHNLAGNLVAHGKYSDAGPLYQKALSIYLKTLGADDPETALTYNNLADNLDAEGRFAEAVQSWRAAVRGFELTRFAGGPSGLERALLKNTPARLSLAVALARQAQSRDAWRNWEADLARGLLDDLSARQLRPLTAEERQRETDILGQLQKVDEQVGKLVATFNRTQNEDQRLDNLRQHQRVLRGQYVALENELATRYREFVGKPVSLEQIQAELPADVALIGWLDLDPKGPPARDRSPYHWACAIRREGDPLWIQIPGTGPKGTWTEEDDRRPEALRAALRSNTHAWLDPALALAQQRLEPSWPHLKGIKRLVVLPSPALAGVPIEVLMETLPAEAPRPIVSYAPSATMFARLSQARTTPAGPARLLALADPDFPPPEPETAPPTTPDHGIPLLAVMPNGVADLAGLKAGDVLLRYNGTDLKESSDLKLVPAEAGAKSIPIQYWRHGEVRTTEVAAGKLGVQLDPKRTASEVLLAQNVAEEGLKSLTRGEAWNRLPGTRREVEAIAALFPKDRVTTLLGEQATEAAFQRLAQQGDLKTYRFLHLATHGKGNPNVAMTSALFLAPDLDRSAQPTVSESDGQITAQQIVNTWDLDADLVVLSACESGLGRLTGGEGYLGFTQALFVKGARSVVLSLWKVDDQATSLLMRRFYENMLGKRPDLARPLRKAEALAEAKAWLRSLDVVQAEQALFAAGLTRGERTAKPAPTANPGRPFEHPYFWAAFLLVGDPN
jgi:tetratricopeptide (TPR) repeat protein